MVIWVDFGLFAAGWFDFGCCGMVGVFWWLGGGFLGVWGSSGWCVGFRGLCTLGGGLGGYLFVVWLVCGLLRISSFLG